METLADKLNRLLEDENADKEIRKIPQDIYRQIASHIKSIRSESSDKDGNIVSALSLAERVMLHKIATRLIQLRVSKYIRDTEADVANLALVERYIVEPLLQSRRREERVALAILNGQTGQLENACNSVRQKFVMVRFLHPYSAISGTDLSTYGPFEGEDVAILPMENAKHLLKVGVVAPNLIELGE